MTESKPRRSRFWEEFDPQAPYAGAKLADLHQGLGEEPGTVPSMWPYHRAKVRDLTVERGLDDWSLTAEHQALTLFSIHQQSQTRSMHWPGVGLGKALRSLRFDKNSSEDAVDMQVRALVTADDTDELFEHLRAFIPRLKRLENGAQGVDYTKLYLDLQDWNFYEKRTPVRRAWAAQYSDWSRPRTKPQAGDAAVASADPQ